MLRIQAEPLDIAIFPASSTMPDRARCSVNIVEEKKKGVEGGCLEYVKIVG